jgi:hypothetical protein
MLTSLIISSVATLTPSAADVQNAFIYSPAITCRTARKVSRSSQAIGRKCASAREWEELDAHLASPAAIVGKYSQEPRDCSKTLVIKADGTGADYGRTDVAVVKFTWVYADKKLTLTPTGAVSEDWISNFDVVNTRVQLALVFGYTGYLPCHVN